MEAVEKQALSYSDILSKAPLSFTTVSSSELHSEVPGEAVSRKVDTRTDLSDADAAVKVQKVYRSYRARRELADSAMVAEDLWWRAIDFTKLNRSTTSFYDSKPESPGSRWKRARLNASKVGKGLSIDSKAQELFFENWIEAIDPRHRYGSLLNLYYKEWCKADTRQPFFYWLDVGDGKEIDLRECPRSKLREQCVTYLGNKEREYYEYIVVEGKIINKKTGDLLDTTKGPRGEAIFVMSPSKKFYAGEKKKGRFHHSSFLAGGATIASGMLTAELGVLKSIIPHSGHYRPKDDRLDIFLSFLKENGINMDEVKVVNVEEYFSPRPTKVESATQVLKNSQNPAESELPKKEEDNLSATKQS